MMRHLPCLLFPALLGQPLCAQTSYEVLVNSRGTNAVFRFDTAGNYLGDFIPSGSGGLIGPEDVLFHPDGSVLVTGFGNTAIKRYDGVSGAYIGEFSTGYSLDTPSKMSIGPDTLVYVTQWGATQNKVVRFDLDGVFVDEFTSIGTPNGLGHFWDAQGDFYISVFGNGANGTVRRFAADGSDLGVFIDSGVLQGPTDIWQGANGDVLVQDWTAGTVLRYDANGQFLSTFISGLTSPEGIAFLPNGDMLMGDWGVDAVHRFDAAGNALGYFTSGNGLTDPNGVHLRVVAAIGVGEAIADEDVLQVVPNIGPGPFELRTTVPLGPNTQVTLMDALGRVVEEAPWGDAKAVPFRMPAKATKKLAPGKYHVLVRDGTRALRAAVVVICER
ncbi:MAG: NHL repeat-containing protein [Flavobacteriales bacterium]|nr:NHL repeat-containing protein [Flavobacteriales bacterium]